MKQQLFAQGTNWNMMLIIRSKVDEWDLPESQTPLPWLLKFLMMQNVPLIAHNRTSSCCLSHLPEVNDQPTLGSRSAKEKMPQVFERVTSYKRL
jgi:hypothetical protein